MANFIAFIAGVLFTAGLAIGGMTNPENVLGFLDFTGNWKPDLVMLMAGGILTYAGFYHLFAKKLKKPILNHKFIMPLKTHVDKSLILGSTIFGIGWGIAGICPGPALSSLFTGSQEIIIFVFCMIIGMKLFQFTNNKI